MRCDRSDSSLIPRPLSLIIHPSSYLLLSFLVFSAPAFCQEKSAELIVWSGDKPAGDTWAKLGPDGYFRVEEGAGIKNGSKGLVLHAEGDGYRGCGLNWKGWFPPDSGDNVSGYNALIFDLRQITPVENADLIVYLADNVKRAGNAPVSNGVAVMAHGGIETIDGTWRRVVLPLARFTRDKPLQLTRLWQIDFTIPGNKPVTFHIDQISFAQVSFRPPHFPALPPYQARARVQIDQEGQPISEGIYGVCGLLPEKLVEYGISVTRWGGNAASRYNWKLNVDNGASDWFFKNRGQLIDRLSETGYLKHIQANRSRGATTYQTVPMLGWVAKDARSYGFSVKKYGPQKDTEPGHPDIGNGIKPDGKPVTGNDPHDTSVEAPPELIEEAVRFVAQHAGRADGSGGKEGVKYWVLDNEPMLWNVTHRDVHPRPLGYDGLWQRTLQYGQAIKRADPTARVAGFCSWGWTDLFYSALDAGDDNYRTRPDWHKHREVGLAEWFLRQCAAYRKAQGKPLVDVFDVHWYPQGLVGDQGVYRGRGRNLELNRLRMRSTRDLWDLDYQQESWIRKTENYTPVALLPRVKKWIADNNPGMELCLGEYNFGGSDNITGGLAQAEVFGILARERLDLAFLWHTPAGTQDLAWQLFRGYDGQRSRFGDHYLPSETNSLDLSVHAARRTKDGALTVVLLNKNLSSPCELTLNMGSLKGTMRVWRFDQDTIHQVQEVKSLAGPVDQTVKLTLPAASASLLVIPGGR